MSSHADRAARHSKELLKSLLSKGSSSSRSRSSSTRSPHFAKGAPSSSSTSSSSTSASSLSALPRVVSFATEPTEKKRRLDGNEDEHGSDSDSDEDDVKWETPQEASKSADRDAALKRVLSEASVSKTSSSSAPSVTVSINRSASAVSFSDKATDDDAKSASSRKGRKHGFGFGGGKKRPNLYNRDDCRHDHAKKKKPKRTGVTKQDRTLALQIHEFQILAFLTRIKARSRLLDSELVQSVMYSRLPENLHSLGLNDITRSDLADLVSFFRSSFHACHDDVEFRLSCGQNLLMMCGEQQLIDVANGVSKGGREHWCMLFVAMCRALNIGARMISTLWPSSLKPSLSKCTPIILDWSIPRCYCGYKPPDPKPIVTSSTSSKKTSRKKRKLTRRSVPATANTPRSSSSGSCSSAAAARSKTSPYFRFGFGSESKAKKTSKSASAPRSKPKESSKPKETSKSAQKSESTGNFSPAESLKISSEGSIDLTSASSAPFPKTSERSSSNPKSSQPSRTATKRRTSNKPSPKSVLSKRKAPAPKPNAQETSSLVGRRSARIAKLASSTCQSSANEGAADKEKPEILSSKRCRISASDRTDQDVDSEKHSGNAANGVSEADSVPEPAALPPATSNDAAQSESARKPAGRQRKRLTRKRRKSASRSSSDLGDTQARTKQKRRRRSSHDHENVASSDKRLARASRDPSETESLAFAFSDPSECQDTVRPFNSSGLQARTKQKRRVSTNNTTKSKTRRTPAKAAKAATMKKRPTSKSADDDNEGEEYVLPDDESEGEDYNEDVEEEDDAYGEDEEDESAKKKARTGGASHGGKKRSRSEVYARVEAKLSGKTPKKKATRKKSSPRSSSSSKKRAPGFWVEIYCPEARKWLHVDCLSGVIDNPKSYSPSAPPIMYAIAAGPNGRLKDVTKRYSDRWSETAKLRAPDVWVKSALHACNDGLEPDELMAKDDGELESFALLEPLPKSLQAFNNHPLYCIEKFVKKYETIYPKYPVLGEIRGFSVYPAANLYTLHSSDLWFKEALVVKAGENPVKIVKASPFSSNQDDVGLFGVWQTEEWTSPPVMNGKVPKNDRGQVDLLSPKHMPRGATHLPIPRLSLTARRLGIDYAPAMIGFEIRKRRSVPVFKGIVVATEHAEMLVEAHHQAERQRAEKAEAKRLRTVLKRWERLVKGSLARHDVLTDDKGAKKFEAANSKIKAAAAKSKINAAAAKKSAAAKRKSTAASKKKSAAAAKKSRRKKASTSSADSPKASNSQNASPDDSADDSKRSNSTRKSTRRRSAKPKKKKAVESEESDSIVKDEDNEKGDGDWSDGGGDGEGSDEEDEEYVSDGEADVLKEDEDEHGDEDGQQQQSEDEEFEM